MVLANRYTLQTLYFRVSQDTFFAWREYSVSGMVSAVLRLISGRVFRSRLAGTLRILRNRLNQATSSTL